MNFICEILVNLISAALLTLIMLLFLWKFINKDLKENDKMTLNPFVFFNFFMKKLAKDKLEIPEIQEADIKTIKTKTTTQNEKDTLQAIDSRNIDEKYIYYRSSKNYGQDSTYSYVLGSVSTTCV
ncbi:MAG: hypothetical protein ACK5KR_03310 [Breznakia sp.]